MKRLIVAALFAASVTFGVVAQASADPISCPPGQTAVKLDGNAFWSCVNNGGNTDHSGDSSNPNGNPNFYR